MVKIKNKKVKLNKDKNKTSYLAEILIVVGLFFIVITTYILSIFVGLYLTGLIAIALGMLLAKIRK
ncbi:MAG: hypothetical protein K9L62_16045 [Vallitaleaceae bacterium]|nr:hypothetical protein [Vallitaleaceae bacterium]